MATFLNPVVSRRRISLRGVVQGVGFRPFVYKLATEIGLQGFVFNSSSGAVIEIEGSESALDRFLEKLHKEPPTLARIEELTTFELEPLGDDTFEIRESQSAAGEFALVSPDVATCGDCLRDIGDPENRRFGYPFTNCTNCGPRYTIIRDIPYDRPTTTMAGFAMCQECDAEYHDPTNRRFHAQPNACPRCGPTVVLAKSGSFFPPETAYGFGHLSKSVMRDVRAVLRDGAIVAIKGLGGFQLACDAENDNSVRQLRRQKKRSDKPFAVMTRDIAAVDQFCEVSEADRELLLSAQHPIVVLPRRTQTSLSTNIAPANATIGVMLAYTPLHFLLFGDQPDSSPEFKALVMTSGNISEEPIVVSNEEAWQRLGTVADWFLFHNRDIYMRVDDSVTRTIEEKPRVLRRSRGYAPQPIKLRAAVEEVLACGAELKNTFCLTKDNYAILSQHIGDLENYETLRFFHETLGNLKNLFRVEPQAVAHDLHPLYLSTRIAAEMSLPKVGVQHHHAHIASCMAENGLEGKVIGVAFDGTGYGTDRKIWGGEFLTADFSGFQRQAHFRYIPLPGGDAAVRQVWRPALSWLREAFGRDLPLDLELFQQIPQQNLALVSRMIDGNVNTILTSSCGRLFDAVASLIGIRQEVTFEGQAAIELEQAIQPGVPDRYPFEIEPSNSASNVPSNKPVQNQSGQIDLRPTIRAIVDDIRRRETKGVIAARFHNTIAEIIANVCSRIRDREHLNRVCLSGGTFQNIYLLQHAVALLRQRNFEVFLHSVVPTNDGGISLGQAVIASYMLTSGA